MFLLYIYTKFGKNMNDRNRRLFFMAACLLAFVLCVPALNAQTVSDGEIQKQLEAKLKNTTLTFRHFYSGSNLKYNSKGILVSGGKPGPWTLNAYFEPEKIKISKKSIEISGTRIWWTYDDTGHTPKLYYAPQDKTKIEISRSREQDGLSGIMASLLTVFLKSDELLEDFVPPYWKKTIQSGFNAEQAMRDMTQTRQAEAKEQTQKRISFPQLKYRLTPEYTEEARKARVEGTVALEGIIDEDGILKVTNIVKPLGAGLDDRTIETVEKTWKFSPAMRDGIPVPYDACIEVHFYI